MKLSRPCLSGLAACATLLAQQALADDSHGTFAYTLPSHSVQLIIDGNPVTASSRGWVDETGFNNGGGSGANYFAGVCGSSDSCSGNNRNYHNYFVFNLSNISSASTAILRLTQPSNGYISNSANLTYSLWDTDAAAASIGSASGVSFFNDLMTGVSFGSKIVDASSNGSFVDVMLNANGLAALQGSFGSQFAFGGAVTLQNGAVPEPSTWALLLLGFAAVGGALRLQRRKGGAALVRS